MSITYSEWVREAGKTQKWGVKAVITDVIAHDKRAREVVMQHLSSALADGAAKNGKKPLGLQFDEEYDAALRGIEQTAISFFEQGSHPVEYVSMAYTAWQDTEQRLENFKNQSLWGFIKFWCKRTSTHWRN